MGALKTGPPSGDKFGYRDGKSKGKMVRRHSWHGRHQKVPPLSERCDDQMRCAHTELRIGQGTPLQSLVDHSIGVHTDHRSENLQGLCPHGEALHYESRGGAHTGRTEQAGGGLATDDCGGTHHEGQHTAPRLYVTSAAGKAA
jgi:hypothetical protein